MLIGHFSTTLLNSKNKNKNITKNCYDVKFNKCYKTNMKRI